MNTQKPPKRHHTVPKFYLRGFTENRDELWQYPRDGSAPHPINVKDATVGKHFNSLTREDGSRNVVLETELAKLETACAPIVRRVASNVNVPSEDKAKLAYYLAIQMVRGHDLRQAAKEFASELRNPDILRARAEKYRDQVSSESYEEFERKHIDSGTGFKADPSYYLPYVFSRAKDWSSRLEGMQWRFERATAGEYFVTSDSPVSSRRRGYPADPGTVGLDRKDLNVEVTFPLTNKTLLVAAWEHEGRLRRSNSRTVTGQRVLELNRITTITAHRYVYSGHRCNQIEELVRNSVNQRVALTGRNQQH